MLRMAHYRDDPYAAYLLGEMAERGWGSGACERRAHRYYAQAAERGMPDNLLRNGGFCPRPPLALSFLPSSSRRS